MTERSKYYCTCIAYRKLLHHKSKVQAKKRNSQIIGVLKFMLECYPSEAAPPGEHVLPNHLKPLFHFAKSDEFFKVVEEVASFRMN